MTFHARDRDRITLMRHSGGVRSARAAAAASKDPPTRPSSALSERLRATEEALVAARATIAQQEKREAELRRRLVADGVALDAQLDNPALEAKVGALKKQQDQKVRALMRSINQLQEQLHTLKAQDQEHRRSALIQGLRKQQREQELLVDVLKQALQEKVPEFQSNRALVNDFVTKKSVGGPLRFRPKTREELENELRDVDQKYKWSMEQLRRERKRGSSRAQANHDSGDDEEDEEDIEADTPRQAHVGDDVRTIDPGMEEELARLRAENASKTVTIHSQADEINELYAELDRSRIVEEKVVRKKHKIEQLRERLVALEAENLTRVHEREAQAEQCLQLQEELQFLRNLNVDDVSAKDEERLDQLEQIQILRARELELQNQLESHQKKWAVDRTNMNQQLRLVEKEKQLADDAKKLAVVERDAASKKFANSLQEIETARRDLEAATARSDNLAKRVTELEALLAKQESLSKEEREAFASTATEKLHSLSLELEQKNEAMKNVERQLNAAKLLVRQGKKDKEVLEDRVAKLQQQLAAPKATE